MQKLEKTLARYVESYNIYDGNFPIVPGHRFLYFLLRHRIISLSIYSHSMNKRIRRFRKCMCYGFPFLNMTLFDKQALLKNIYGNISEIRERILIRYDDTKKENQITKPGDNPVISLKCNHIQSKKKADFDNYILCEYFKLHINCLGEYMEILNKVGKNYELCLDEADIIKLPANFTGKSATEFVQWVTGMLHSGYFNNGIGHHLELSEQLAPFFNVSLGKHWKDNFSKSLHRTNADYLPEIFDKPGKAYQMARDNILEMYSKRN